MIPLGGGDGWPAVRSDRRGFTLIELLVVSVLGVIVLGATYQVLVVNQRTYTANAAKVASQQAVRSAAEVLFGELREISVAGGDVIGFGADSLKVRVVRQFGLVCTRNIATGQLTVRTMGDAFEVDDSVVVFAETDTATVSDDAWVVGRVGSSTPNQTCGGGTAQIITVSAVSAAAATPTFDTVQVGAPVRTFVHYTYRLVDMDGETYLGRVSSTGGTVPLAGPLQAEKGLQFAYYDTLGNVAATIADIAQVEVTLRALSEARWTTDGGLVGDSLTTKIFTRN